MEEITKNKTLKHIVKPHDKPEHILNIIVQGSDNKILFIKIYQLLALRPGKILHHCNWAAHFLSQESTIIWDFAFKVQKISWETPPTPMSPPNANNVEKIGKSIL